MKTYFTVDSFPGQRFLGKIRQIRNAATTVQNVVTYDAVIDVDNTDLRLRPGMTANVTVVYAERKDVLAVSERRAAVPAARRRAATGCRRGGRCGPRRHAAGTATAASAGADGARRAIRDAPEAKTVWVLRGGSARSRSTIHTGLTDGTVHRGRRRDLNEGDPVIVDIDDGERDGSAAALRRRAPPRCRMF